MVPFLLCSILFEVACQNWLYSKKNPDIALNLPCELLKSKLIVESLLDRAHTWSKIVKTADEVTSIPRRDGTPLLSHFFSTDIIFLWIGWFWISYFFTKNTTSLTSPLSFHMKNSYVITAFRLEWMMTVWKCHTNLKKNIKSPDGACVHLFLFGLTPTEEF